MVAVLNTSQPRTAPRTMPQAPAFAIIDGGRPRSALDEDLCPLEVYGVKAKYARNQLLFGEGDAAAFAYRLASGVVRLCKLTPGGRRQIAGFVLPGDVFGLDMLDTYALSAEAVGDVVVVRYPRRQIERLSEENPRLRLRVMKLLCERLTAAENHLLVLGRQTAKERVVSFLLTLAERLHAGDGDSITLAMGRQDIADHLGLTIETVCRVLTGLKRGGLIRISDIYEISLTDIDALQDLLDSDC